MTNFDLIAEAINFINTNDSEKAIARLNQFVALNTPKVKSTGKLKIYDWCCKKEWYPNIMGVYHDAENKFYEGISYSSLPLTFESFDGNYKALLMPLWCPDETRDMIKVGE